jgi:hypothetical protein
MCKLQWPMLKSTILASWLGVGGIQGDISFGQFESVFCHRSFSALFQLLSKDVLINVQAAMANTKEYYFGKQSVGSG